MLWILSSLTSLRGRSCPSQRAPRRTASPALEDLEGRQLLSRVDVFPVDPTEMVAGPSGSVYVGLINGNTNTIDQISPKGTITSYAVPGTGQGLNLASEPDGNVAFVFYSTGSANPGLVVGQMTPSGQFTETPIPNSAGQYVAIVGVVPGTSGDEWVAWQNEMPSGQNQSFVAHVTAAGAVTVFPVSSIGSGSIINTIAEGPDGNLWFGESSNTSAILGRITPSGVQTQFPVPQAVGQVEVADGPDGNLIVTAGSSTVLNQVFEVSTAGKFTQYKIAAGISKPFYDYLGSVDGSLWFAPANGTTVGRINAKGVATAATLSHSIPNDEYDPSLIALGSDGKLDVLDIVSAGLRTKATVYRLSLPKLPRIR